MLENMVVPWREEKARLLARLRHVEITREILVRICVDMFLVNFALAVSIAARCLWTLGVEGSNAPTQPLIVACFYTFLRACLPLTVTSLLIFALTGFYTRTRAYRIRYKMLTVARAVSVTYLVFGFEILLLRDAMPYARSALLASWLLTMLLLTGVRLYAATLTAADDGGRPSELSKQATTEPDRVLIIGGAGYIGSALTRRLLALGYQVRVLDLLLYGDEPIQPFYTHPKFELIRGDFRHIDAVVQAMRGVDSVVHLGAIVGDSACKLCGELTVEINLRATRTIAEVGKGYGVRRFIFASTCSVYGASDETLDEHSALNPISLYARTKVESERVLLSLADADFAPVILRFGTVYGLSGRPRFDLVVNLLTAKAIQDGQVGIIGGQQWRPFVHVTDVAEAIRLALEAPRASVCGQIFNVGSDEQNYQIAELGHLIAGMVPTANVITEPKEDDRNYRVRFDKIKDILGFRPAYNVTDGIAQIIEAFASGRLTDYRDPRYNNLAFLRDHGELRRALIEDGLIRDELAVAGEETMAATHLHSTPVAENRPELLTVAVGGSIA